MSGAAGGGVMGPRNRTPRKRLKQRRQFRGTVRAGVLTVGRGAYVTTIARDGTPITENVWDQALRLYANLGDTLILCGADIVAVRIIGVTQRGVVEDWKLSPVAPDGAAIVMRGPK